MFYVMFELTYVSDCCVFALTDPNCFFVTNNTFFDRSRPVQIISIFILSEYLLSVTWRLLITRRVYSILFVSVGTGFLWWTFYQEHTQHNEDHMLTVPVLRIDIQNERAFLIFSIVASVFTVIHLTHTL